MANSGVMRLIADLKTLDTLVDSLENHAEADMPLDEKQYMLTEDICGIYNAQAWYLSCKQSLLDNPPKEEESMDVRIYIHKKVDLKERAVLNKFKDLREKISKYQLNENNNKRINNYITSHPVLSKWVSLGKEAD